MYCRGRNSHVRCVAVCVAVCGCVWLCVCDVVMMLCDIGGDSRGDVQKVLKKDGVYVCESCVQVSCVCVCVCVCICVHVRD